MTDSRVWRRAAVINAGQNVWSFQAGVRESSTRYGTSGQVQSLGRQYTRVLSWRELVRGENSKEAKAEVQKYMDQNGLRENDIAATSDYEVSRRETGFASDWAYGLTRNWMVGLQIPLTYRQTKVRSRVNMTPKLVNLRAQSLQLSTFAATSTDDDLYQKVTQLAQNELTNSGYDNVPSQKESWDWGDVNLLSQFEILQTYRWTWSLQQLVRIPTAQNNNVADYIQTSDDQGQVDLGISSLVDFEWRSWILGARVGYVSQLSDRVKMRVPNDERNDGEINPEVRRDLGDWAWAAVDAEWRVLESLDLNIEYGYLAKAKDQYSNDYLNSTATDQELHQSRVGMLYHIGDNGSRSGVENKWIASLGYTFPLSGRNSLDSSRTSLDVITYF